MIDVVLYWLQSDSARLEIILASCEESQISGWFWFVAGRVDEDIVVAGWTWDAGGSIEEWSSLSTYYWFDSLWDVGLQIGQCSIALFYNFAYLLESIYIWDCTGFKTIFIFDIVVLVSWTCDTFSSIGERCFGRTCGYWHSSIFYLIFLRL